MRERVLYIIIGVLIGVVVMQWQQGPQPAQAQAPDAVAGYRAVGNGGLIYHEVMLSNGDIYQQSHSGDSAQLGFRGDGLIYVGNFWDGGPTPTNPQSWGGIKGKYGDD